MNCEPSECFYWPCIEYAFRKENYHLKVKLILLTMWTVYHLLAELRQLWQWGPGHTNLLTKRKRERTYGNSENKTPEVLKVCVKVCSWKLRLNAPSRLWREGFQLQNPTPYMILNTLGKSEWGYCGYWLLMIKWTQLRDNFWQYYRKYIDGWLLLSWNVRKPRNKSAVSIFLFPGYITTSVRIKMKSVFHGIVMSLL